LTWNVLAFEPHPTLLIKSPTQGKGKERKGKERKGKELLRGGKEEPRLFHARNLLLAIIIIK
jgi:hypothetical protein